MRLKSLREDSDLTQRELAEKLNIAQNTYSQYENGVHQLPIDILIKLADYYNTSTDYILERTEEPQPYPPKRHEKAPPGKHTSRRG